MSPEMYGYLKKPLSAEALKEFWGLSGADLGKLTELSEFMNTMQLTRQEAERLFVQDISETDEDREALLHGLYLNESLMGQTAFLFIEDEKVRNLNLDTLERICVFLRLTRIFGVTFEEMDWLLKQLGLMRRGTSDFFWPGRPQGWRNVSEYR